MPRKWLRIQTKRIVHTITTAESDLSSAYIYIPAGGFRGTVRITNISLVYASGFHRAALGYRISLGQYTYEHHALFTDHCSGAGFGHIAKAFCPYVEVKDINDFFARIDGDLVDGGGVTLKVQFKYREDGN